MKTSWILSVYFLFIVGCAPTYIQPSFEDSNQYFLEKTINQLDVGKELRGLISPKYNIALLSIENNLTLDKYETEFIYLSNKYKIPIIISNNVKFIEKGDYNAHDILLCIANKSTINQEKRIRSNPNLFFKGTEIMHELFNDIPEIIENNLAKNIRMPKIEKRLPEYVGEDEMKNIFMLSSNDPIFIRDILMIDLMYDIPSNDDMTEVTITYDMVRDRKKPRMEVLKAEDESKSKKRA